MCENWMLPEIEQNVGMSKISPIKLAQIARWSYNIRSGSKFLTMGMSKGSIWTEQANKECNPDFPGLKFSNQCVHRVCVFLVTVTLNS